MCQVQFSIISSTAATQGSHYVQLTLRSMKLRSTFLRAKYLHQLFGMSLHVRTSILLHLFIYSITCACCRQVVDASSGSFKISNAIFLLFIDLFRLSISLESVFAVLCLSRNFPFHLNFSVCWHTDVQNVPLEYFLFLKFQ